MSAQDFHLDGNFSVPVRAGPARVILPFVANGDTQSALLVAPYVISADSYLSRGRPVLDAPCPFAPGFFLVEQGDPTEELSLFRFTRTFAQTPANRLEYESSVFSPPAERAAYVSQNIVKIDGYFENGRDIGFDFSAGPATPSLPGGFPADAVITGKEDRVSNTTSLVGGVETVTGTDRYTRWNYTRDYNWNLGAFIDSFTANQGRTKPFVVRSVVDVKYYHTSSPESIPLVQTQLTVDRTGEWVVAPSALGRCIEATTVRRWKGNIWEARTRYAAV